MRIDEVLAKVDKIKPNQYDDAIKIDWLSQLDGKIMEEVIKTHELPLVEVETVDNETGEVFSEYVVMDTTFNGYDEYSMSTELIVKGSYADIYESYLYAMIDISNNETDRIQNSLQIFNTRYQQFENWYNRKHKPLINTLKLF